MQIFDLEHDISVIAVRAKSFPDGIMDAFEALNPLLANREGPRTLYGLSRMQADGGIEYVAAAGCNGPGEAAEIGAEYIVIPKGKYASVILEDWAKNIPMIGQTFDQLCSNPGLDPVAYCVEWYFSPKDLRCMVKLVD